jgi:vitamin K-dependent gamma-carboxylase-like protein
MRKFLHALGGWFFERGDPRVAAALRIAYCALVLLILWDFYPVMPLLFGHRGMMGTMEPVLTRLTGIRYFLFHHDSPAELQVWFWASVAFAAMAMAGLLTRFSLLFTFVSMMLFRERGPFMTFGADLVLNCLGVWLLFLDCGRAASVDQLLWRRAGRAGEPTVPATIELWPVKAIQIQVALVYLVTGLKKIQTIPWQDGSAVYYAVHVGNVIKGQPAPWIVHHHALMALMNYGTLGIELAVPFMLFVRPLRVWAMAAAFLMHTGIDVFMSIRFFSLAMYVGYVSFLDAGDWSWWASRLGRVRADGRRSAPQEEPLAAAARENAGPAAGSS